MTCLQSSNVQCSCCFAQFNLLLLRSKLKCGFFIRLRANKPSLTNRRRIARIEIFTPLSLTLLLMHAAVIFLSFNAILTIYLSVAGVVLAFLPLPCLVFGEQVSEYLLHTLSTPEAVTPPPILAAICLKLYPSCRRVTAITRFLGDQSSLL